MIEQFYQQGIALFRQNRFNDAYQAAKQIQKAAPRSWMGHHLEGLLWLKNGKPKEAEPLLRQAYALSPDNEGVRYALAKCLGERGQFEQAEDALAPLVVEGAPEPYWRLHGRLLTQLERLDEAERALARAQEMSPGTPALENEWGKLLSKRDKDSEASERFSSVIQRAPGMTQGYINLAKTLRKMDPEDPQPLSLLENAVRLAPQQPATWLAFIEACLSNFQFRKAAGALKSWAESFPNLPEHTKAKAMIAMSRQRHDQAIVLLREYLKHEPDEIEALAYLRNCLHSVGGLDQALEVAEKLIALEPKTARHWNYKGSILLEQSHNEAALQAFETARGLGDKSSGLKLNIVRARMNLCDWSQRAEDEALFVQTVREELDKGEKAENFPLLNFNYLEVPLELHDRAARSNAASIAKVALRMLAGKRFEHQPGPRERLRIGYISPDFRNHPVGRQLKDFFQHHDRGRFEVFAYSLLDAPDDDATRKKIRETVDHFHEVSRLSSIEVAERIHADRIDILVDCAGYTAHGRNEVAAMRPAPVQCQYYGFADNMGAEFIDYVIADPHILPPALQEHYRERGALLPFSFLWADFEWQKHRRDRAGWGLPQDRFLFFSFNSVYKFEPKMFDIWMRVLKACPQADFCFLESSDKALRDNILREAADRGVAPERIRFLPKLPTHEFIARNASLDFFLDTLNFSACSTALNVVETGTPLLTFPQATNSSRMAMSIVRSAGMEEMVCQSLEEFEAKAIHYAHNPHELAAIRQRTLRDRDKLPFFRTDWMCRWFEQAYEKMWDRYSQGNPPERFEIEWKA